MVPSVASGLDEIGELSLISSVTVWSHAVLGSVTEVLAIILIVYWAAKGPSLIACGKLKKWMTPIFIIWVIAVINGALVHILGLL